MRAAAAATPTIPELSSKLDPSSLEAVFSILKQQNEALRALEVRLAEHLETLICFYTSTLCILPAKDNDYASAGSFAS